MRWENYLHIALSLHVLNYLPSNCVHSQLSMGPVHNNMLLLHTHTQTLSQTVRCMYVCDIVVDPAWLLQ